MERSLSPHVVVDNESVTPQVPRSGRKLTEQPIAEAQLSPANAVAFTSWLRGEDSGRSTRISIVSETDGHCLATALITLAEESSSFARFKLPRAALERCVVLSDVALDPAAGDVLPALVYACLRRARIWDRPTVTTVVAKGRGEKQEQADRFDLTPLSLVAPLEQGGDTWVPVAQRVELSIHRAWAASPPDMQVFLREQFVPEAVETLERWMEHFFKTPWFQSIYDGTLTKEQYVYSLSNMHQFVRWTTRLIGLAVSHSHNRLIRNKWLEHLQEEVNHELIIERDLAGLGADVHYVVNEMVPSVSVQQFMVAQESAIAFHRDPVLFMAAPFVAEGFTGRLDQKFIACLRKAAKSWGIENPKQVTAFWASHIEYDGGEGGHFEDSLAVLGFFLNTDADLLRFLNIVRLSCDAFLRSYSSYVEDLAIFAATSGTG